MKNSVEDVTEEDVWNSHKWLARTDAEWAKKDTKVTQIKERLKTVIAVEKIHSEAKSNAAKEDEALASDAYKAELDAYHKALLERATLKAQRESAERQVEIGRSLMASRRKT